MCTITINWIDRQNYCVNRVLMDSLIYATIHYLNENRT